MYDEYIDEFMLSEEMREYLKTVDLYPFQITELIYYSQVPVVTKREALRKLLHQAKERKDMKLIEECENCLWNIDEAMKLIEQDGVFSVELFERDPVSFEEEDWFETICASLSDIRDCMKEVREGYKDGYKDSFWFYIEKWEKDDAGKFQIVCSFILKGDSILYTELEEINSMDDNLNIMLMRSGVDLNLPVPFKIGDLLEIDGFPFDPKMLFLIVGIGDNRDCCCVQALSRWGDNDWKTAAVKHGMIGGYDFPMVSPLYTAHKYDGPLPKEEHLLEVVREYVLKVDPSKEEPYIALYHFGETEDAILKGLAESEYFNS